MRAVIVLLCLNFFSTIAISEPGIISQVPLGLQNRIDSNIMFLLDSSGSMARDLSQQCESEYRCQGVSRSPCFNNDDCGVDGEFGHGEGWIMQSGYHYWGERYFNNCTELNTKQTMTCISSRNYVMKKVATERVNEIDDFYVGIMRFNGEEGGRLSHDLTYVDKEDEDNYSDVIETLNKAIEDINPTDWTPLAESFSSAGYYFSLNGPEPPTLTPTIDGGFVMTMDTDDPNYIFRRTQKETAEQKSVNSLFHSMAGLNNTKTPSYNANGKNDELKNEGMPIKGWCQRNFLIALTDGEPTADDNIKSTLRYYEKTGNSKYLADVAGALWDMDLRTDLCDPNLLTELNDKFKVNMENCTDLLTTVVTNNLTAYEWLELEDERTSDDNNVANDNALARYKNNIRSYVIGFASTTVTDNPLMQQASRLGAGGFYGAEDEAALNNVFKSILDDISASNSSSSGIGLSLSPGANNNFMYRASFETQGWSGELGKYPLLRKSGVVDIDKLNPDWTTNKPNTFRQHNKRNILTWDSNLAEGIPFRWKSIKANNNHPLKKDLMTNPEGLKDNLGAKRLNYLRGDKTYELSENNPDAAFRDRDRLLGDIVHSTPKFVGKIKEGVGVGSDDITNLLSRWSQSITLWTDGEPYSSPKRAKDIVYVNSNNGMLHAFDDKTGRELFAYLPSFIASEKQEEGLHFLTDPEYTHRFYNDATPYIDEDVWIKDKGWRTLLVSGVQAGGKGIFLLDVTDVPKENNAKEAVIWEFTHPDLGYTYSEPYVGVLRNGKWAVIIGNGYNSEKGTASVFIVYVEPENLSDGWDEGSDYIQLETNIGEPNESEGFGKNGMSTVIAADIFQDFDGKKDLKVCSSDKKGLHLVTEEPCFKAGDMPNGEDKELRGEYFYPHYGTIDRLYGGDLYGNLWAFNLVSSDPSEWHIDNGGKALFQTQTYTDEKGITRPQPITTAPTTVWMSPVIQKCDDLKTERMLFNGIEKPILVGHKFGDQSVLPFEYWEIDKLDPLDAQTLDDRNLTCGPNILVMFGTGKFLTEKDPKNTKPGSFYAVWDNHKVDKKDYPLTINNLDKRQFNTTLSSDTNQLVRTIIDVDGVGKNEIETTQWHIQDEYGWYVDFDQPGERMVSDPVYYWRTGEVFFTTIIPEDEACGFGGISFSNRLNAKNGLLSNHTNSNATFAGIQLLGLATGVQFLGSDDPDDPDFAAFGGSGVQQIKIGDPPPPNQGILSMYEIKQ